MGFEHIDHTADIGIRAFGEDLEEAFEETARGMFSIITDLSKVQTVTERSFEIESENLENLLVNFLSELIYLHEVKNEFYREFEVEIIGEEKLNLKAVIKGEKVDLERHDVDTAVKAVSYHELSIDPEGEIEIILDI